MSAEEAKEQTKQHLHVTAIVHVKKDKLGEFGKAVNPLVVATNKEQGCVRYNIHQDKKDVCKFVFIEEWDSQENLSNHLKAEHVKAFGKHKDVWDDLNIFICGGPVVKLE
mmetsp:Transcript_14765/g.22212  ORF Transcript_14765/g.22212 Transcript_14765/m.22212 type:complete len:110 (+) Transcript_14765:610-939(+)|eukprot:CAMPEP_0202711218 /NCGR_PEP_ID=MMETSP1385-20130828/23064_1 /ASSEMBLY_ACC=CAM_ASM_000861 /TAXON_ID=933848 /ORGANISM="Elphidium margaritaceum" /LENGTH=109 /DNA_ID=CAMNT_0049370905 /DNA_START=411 /DNA_END=740 /DNA_ORIENTATION=+